MVVSPPTNALAHKIDPATLTVLEDIVNNVTIHDDFSVYHPLYQPYTMPLELRERLAQLPTDLQKKYKMLALRNFLYGLYYSGALRSELALNHLAKDQSLDIENSSFLGVDLAFFEHLHQANRGTGYFEPGWQVLDQTNPDKWIVSNGSLRFTISPTQHVTSNQRQVKPGDTISIWLPKNRVQNGFYVAMGNTHLDLAAAMVESPSTLLLRIYFNLMPEGAALLMQTLTAALNRMEVPFHFKTLYNPKDYNRYDSAVLYISPRSYSKFQTWFQSTHMQYQNYLKPDIPLFTKGLAPGVGLAEEPNFKFSTQESFGLNRCQMIAKAMMAAADIGQDSTLDRLLAIEEEFTNSKISLTQPFLNPNSVDNY